MTRRGSWRRRALMGDSTLLVHCHVFDGSGADVRRDQDVLVRDGKIAGVGPSGSAAAPDGAEGLAVARTDGKGGVFHPHTNLSLAPPGALGGSVRATSPPELGPYGAGRAA